MSIFNKIKETEHEQIVFCNDRHSNLKAIVAIHNTVLGPGLGGLRIKAYLDEKKALDDVLRLSRGMTYKNAIAKLNLGGAKAVIIADPKKDKTELLLRTFGKFIERLNGRYITAEDLGTTISDMGYIAMETNYVSGTYEGSGGLGDPSPHTAYTTYKGMKAAAKIAYKNESLYGKKVGIQGAAGNVAKHLIEFLIEEKSEIYVNDVQEDKLNQLIDFYKKKGWNLKKLDLLDRIYDIGLDIYAPCAVGSTVNDDTIKRLKNSGCSIIAGCANNQLQDEKKHGNLLLEYGIIYAPDFVINCGGVVNVYAEVKNFNRDWVKKKLKDIDVYNLALDIINRSIKKNKSTHDIAMEIARERINNIKKMIN